MATLILTVFDRLRVSWFVDEWCWRKEEMFKKVAGRMRLDPENVTHVRLHSSVIVTRYSATISGEKVRPQRLYQAAGTISKLCNW
jgi:hypothetical protein